jgi:hypothetical protein
MSEVLPSWECRLTAVTTMAGNRTTTRAVGDPEAGEGPQERLTRAGGDPQGEVRDTSHRERGETPEGREQEPAGVVAAAAWLLRWQLWAAASCVTLSRSGTAINDAIEGLC